LSPTLIILSSSVDDADIMSVKDMVSGSSSGIGRIIETRKAVYLIYTLHFVESSPAPVADLPVLTSPSLAVPTLEDRKVVYDLGTWGSLGDTATNHH
jgi:hypothetical protein